jgi:ferrous iron transport protein B
LTTSAALAGGAPARGRRPRPARLAGPKNWPHDASPRAATLGDDIDILVADARYGLAHHIARQVAVSASGQVAAATSPTASTAWCSTAALGIPIFLVMMYLMFMFTINIGGAFIDFFDQFAARSCSWTASPNCPGRPGAPEWLQVLLAKGIGGGLQTVATFIPVIGFLYLFLSVLEDSGYMARAAFVMDRFMRWVGLPGKSFVPLIVGFGCNVPAIMATRTLEHRRDRLMTIAMAPFMSCGARLPVYVLFAAAFFPQAAHRTWCSGFT